MKTKIKLKKIEIALLFGLSFAVLWGVWSMGGQQSLADRVIRLHVIANSDTSEDQALKLKVRDKVLETVDGMIERGDDLESAQEKINAALEPIADEAKAEVRANGYPYPVTATLETAYFPTKQYEGFALPAGDYTALRIVIGEGSGKNWWCVVFPPLCVAAASKDMSETALSAGLTEEDIALITEEDTRYVFKFKSIEIWQNIKDFWS